MKSKCTLLSTNTGYISLVGAEIVYVQKKRERHWAVADVMLPVVGKPSML